MRGEPLRGSLAGLLRKPGRFWPRVGPRIPAAFTLAAFVAVGWAALAAGASPALADTPVPANPGAARLQGSFLLAGQVTSAKGVRGVHAGQSVLRTWNFTADCAAGDCDTVTLDRERTGGRDIVVLHRAALGYYTGAGGFYAPVRCGQRTYANGQAIPFTITVRVTSAVLSEGADIATRIDATYTNRTRNNLTPCVAQPGHVTATYHGHLVQPTPPTPPASGGAGA